MSGYLPNGQKKFFSSIAEYVAKGRYIILKTDESQTKFVFEKGKVQELKGEVVFHEKNLRYDYLNVRGNPSFCVNLNMASK